MGERLTRTLYRWAATIAMRRPAPNRIPLAGNVEAVRARNYSMVHLGGDTDPMRFLLREIEPAGFRGLWFPGPGSESEERLISDDEIPRHSILITFYFHELELRYSSALRFVLHRAFAAPRLQLWLERTNRFVFNQRSLSKGDSIKILRTAIDWAVNDPDVEFGASTVMTMQYGVRWVHHPQQVALHGYYSLLLRGLAARGDIVATQHSYRVAPQALLSLEHFHEEDQKFRANMKLQRWVFRLTIVAALIGLGQIIAALVTADKPISAFLDPIVSEFRDQP